MAGPLGDAGARPAPRQREQDVPALAKSLDRATLVDRAAAAVREEILAGALLPGTQIHLGSTADRLGVSPIPVREALRVLVSEGLVDQAPQRGFRVRPVSTSDLVDTYRMRSVLDPLATGLAIPRLTDDTLTRLDATLRALHEAYLAQDRAAIRRLHRDFHFGIYEAAASPWLLRFLSMLWENSERYQYFGTARVDTEHRQIYEACAARDTGRAEELVREHLELTRRRLEVRFAQLEETGALAPEALRAAAAAHQGAGSAPRT